MRRILQWEVLRRARALTQYVDGPAGPVAIYSLHNI